MQVTQPLLFLLATTLALPTRAAAPSASGTAPQALVRLDRGDAAGGLGPHELTQADRDNLRPLADGLRQTHPGGRWDAQWIRPVGERGGVRYAVIAFKTKVPRGPKVIGSLLVLARRGIKDDSARLYPVAHSSFLRTHFNPIRSDVDLDGDGLNDLMAFNERARGPGVHDKRVTIVFTDTPHIQRITWGQTRENTMGLPGTAALDQQLPDWLCVTRRDGRTWMVGATTRSEGEATPDERITGHGLFLLVEQPTNHTLRAPTTAWGIVSSGAELKPSPAHDDAIDAFKQLTGSPSEPRPRVTVDAVDIQPCDHGAGRAGLIVHTSRLKGVSPPAPGFVPVLGPWLDRSKARKALKALNRSGLRVVELRPNPEPPLP